MPLMMSLARFGCGEPASSQAMIASMTSAGMRWAAQRRVAFSAISVVGTVRRFRAWRCVASRYVDGTRAHATVVATRYVQRASRAERSLRLNRGLVGICHGRVNYSIDAGGGIVVLGLICVEPGQVGLDGDRWEQAG